ncbi:hypothetical protein GCM10007103_25650 [Salinimicrobium marinum]|uniref:LVIVD repeat-containing protein n=1 Tax=Salinimicrobium marinum TaxID=680283 RepID=A0A918SIZ4_9FLAO|nr:hypothetical protein [Salinimicrobium marinum]GHA43243.1 hypothetical protein GCM10007103_25650 [Salinimicrobium marinum]
MRKLFIIFIAVVFTACSGDTDSASPSSGDGTGGSLARFALVGDYLYTVDDQSLRIFDIVDPDLPKFVGDKYIGFDIETLYSLDEYLFVGSRLGMFIFNISDPKFPLQLSAVEHVRSCDPVVSSGDYTYVTLHTNASCAGTVNQLEIYDTKDLLRPELLVTVMLDRPIGLGLYENYLLVTDKKVVRIFDVTDPANPDLVGGIEEDAFDLIIMENDLFLIGDQSLSQYTLNPSDIADVTFKSTIDFY